MFFGQVGGNGGQLGVVDKFSIFLRGNTPPSTSKRGRPFCPLLRRGPVRPKGTYPKNKGVRVRHGLRASGQRVGIGFLGAGWGTWERPPWACALSVPPK